VGQADSIIHARAPLAEPRVTPRVASAAQAGAVTLTLHEDLASVEPEWRALEASGDCTPFQTFDWLAAWQRHIGVLNDVRPAIILARRGSDALFLLPLAVEPTGFVRRLTFLGESLADYNAPLLARDAARSLSDQFVALWRESLRLIQSRPALRHDMVVLPKMPKRIGAQDNPMLTLAVRLHPSNAYETALTDDWETFYNAKRSSATRRRDRTKLKKLGDLGAVRFVEPRDDELPATMDTLIAQKSRAFERMGVPNMFARGGHAAFYRDLAQSQRALVHVSRLDVGDTMAAVNLGLTFGDCYYHILASYDDGEVSRFGPGAAHLRELLQYAIRRGCKRFDFTIGDESYKRDWCESEQQLFDHSAAVTLRGLPSAAVAMAWGRTKRAIKHSAWAWTLTQRLRAMAAALRKGPEKGEPKGQGKEPEAG
jgi:CelD/BcsL family acetyltransferase involved in cellulose biosynthesis